MAHTRKGFLVVQRIIGIVTKGAPLHLFGIQAILPCQFISIEGERLMSVAADQLMWNLDAVIIQHSTECVDKGGISVEQCAIKIPDDVPYHGHTNHINILRLLSLLMENLQIYEKQNLDNLQGRVSSQFYPVRRNNWARLLHKMKYNLSSKKSVISA